MISTYVAWNDALAERFFRTEMAGRSVYLSVDDEVLAELAPQLGVDPEAASESLASAVRAELSSPGSHGLFANFLMAKQRWRADDGGNRPPPYIALHALAVLAGSRMARDPDAGIASHNFYVRYNQLIGRDETDGQPPGFDELGRLWEDLDHWLDEDQEGGLGRSTIRKHPRLSHIGYPISQCLLRDADRRHLTEFFVAMGLEPGDEITGAELFTYLRNWARPGRGLSAPAIRIIKEAPDEVATEVAAMVKREFDEWRGEVLDERGRVRGEIALVLEVGQGGHKIAAAFWPRCPDGFPSSLAARLPSGSELVLEKVVEGWYGPLPLEVRAKDLERGLSLESDGRSLTYAPSRVLPFRASEELGRWVSVRQLRAVEPHCVLTHVSLADDVRKFLNAHAEPGWRPMSSTGALPSGWELFDHVRITTHAAAPGEHLDRLVPRFGTASRLEGGLEIAPDQYLVGGEPDLWVTVAEGDRANVVIDGEPADLSTGVVCFRLSEHGLKPGEHSVQVGGLTRRFTTFGGFESASPSGTGSLGEVLRAGRGYAPEAVGALPLADAGLQHGTVQVSGASAIAHGDAELPEGDAPPVLLPARFEHYTVLGRVPGQVLETWDRGKPWWLNGVGLGDQYQFFDQPVPFEAEWVVLKGRGGSQIRPMRRPVAAPAAVAPDDPTSVDLWRKAIIQAGDGTGLHPDDEQVWTQYVERARQAEVAI